MENIRIAFCGIIAFGLGVFVLGFMPRMIWEDYKEERELNRKIRKIRGYDNVK